MKLVRQPDKKQCGQACVAMVCGITLDEASMLARTKGKTQTKHLKRVLHAKGVKHGERRLPGMPKEGSALLYWKSETGYYHWTVWHKKKHYDPLAGVFRNIPNYLSEARVLSHLPITL